MTLVSKKRCQSSSLIASNGLGSNMPRLLTRMSASPACRTKSATPSARARSAGIPSTRLRGTAPLSRSTAAATLSPLRPLITTAAPACASPRAIAKPMPAVDPVTMARLLLRSMIMPIAHLCWLAFTTRRAGIVSRLAENKPNGRANRDMCPAHAIVVAMVADSQYRSQKGPRRGR
jgi:hypothetical protein